MEKKSLKIVVLCMLSMLIFMGCRSGTKESYSQSDDLKGWVGTYSFAECYSKPDHASLFMDYKITIYQEEEEHFADIKMTGQTTQASIRAEVYGNDEWISLVFQQYLPDHVMGGINDTSSVLLSFRKEESDIYTYWGELKPMLYENEDSGKIYFQLESGSQESR